MNQKQTNGPSAAEPGTNVEMERLVESARDALTDDMVVRLSGVFGDSLDLLDRINRSGILRALPAITQLVENGDLERLVSLARLIAAIEDSISDDIVHRLSSVGTELAALVDRLARSDGLLRLVDLIGRDDVQRALADFAEAACTAREQVTKAPPARGGLGGLWKVAKDPGTHEALRFLGLIGNNMRRTPE